LNGLNGGGGGQLLYILSPRISYEKYSKMLKNEEICTFLHFFSFFYEKNRNFPE